MGKFDVNTTIGVDFKVNKVELETLKKELQSLKAMSFYDFFSMNKGLDINKAKEQFNQLKNYSTEVQQALNNAFNTDLGTMNITKLSTELRKLPIADIYRSFQQAGTAGSAAFNSISSAVLKGNLQLKESNALLDKMATTMSNTIRFGISSSIFNNLTNSIQKSWEFTKQLDTSLNDIRIVTSKSADEMERFAQIANKTSQNLGATTQDYTKAALIYYQQGLSDEETQARANVTLKTANVTGQQASQVSEQLTAIWNGYKVSADEAELYIDKVARVAAITAADLEELSTGMSKVASAANLMGVDVDQLNAQLATIVSVTRQAPESVGTALKTIFARISDIKSGLDDETTLGNYTSKMAEMGINVLDTNGKLRDMGGVIEEIGEKWTSMSREQQIALAQTMAGQRQYNNLLALFDNWDMYTKALDESKHAVGELQKQQDIYMQSTEAHLNKLTAAQERIGDAFIDNKGMNNLIDIFTGLTNGVANFIEALGGGGNIITTFGAIATKVFSKQIASGINQMVENMQVAKQNAKALEQQLSDLKWEQDQLSMAGFSDAGLNTKIQYRQQMQNFAPNMKPAQIEQGNALIDNLGNAVSQQEQYNRSLEHTKELLHLITGNEYTKIYDTDGAGGAFLDDIDAQEKLRDFMAEWTQLDHNIDTATESLQKYGEAQDKANAQGQESTQTIKAQVSALNNIAKSIEDTGFDKNWLLNSDMMKDLAPSMKEQLSKDFAQLRAWAQDEAQLDDIINASPEKLQAILENIKNFVSKAKNELGGLQETINTEEMTKGQQTNFNQKNVDSQKEQVEGFMSSENRKALIEDIVKMSGAVTSFISVWNTLANLPSIWNDENLSTGEKFLQTLMAISTVVPMVITGVQDLTSGWQSMSGILKELPAKIIAMATAKTADAAASTGSAVASTAAAGAEAAEGTAAAAATPSVGALAAATWSLAWPVLAVVAAVGALSLGICALVSAYNSQADATQRANETAQEAAENYDKLNTKAEELKTTISDFSDAKQELSDLTVGTEEYTNALEDANKKAKELIETYGLYNDYHMEDGLITFNNGVLENLQKEVDLQKQRAENMKYYTRMQADQANLNLDSLTLKRNIEQSNIINQRRAVSSFGITTLTDTNPLSISEKTINNIVSKMNDLSDIEYSRITQSDKAFSDWVKDISDSKFSVTLLSKQIGENRQEFMSLAKSTKEVIESQKYYMSQMNQNAIEQRYSKQIEAMSSDVRTGEVDAARYSQILGIVNNSDVQERIQQQKLQNEQEWNNKASNLNGDAWTDPEAWGHEWEQMTGSAVANFFTLGAAGFQGNLNTMVTDNLKGIGVSDDLLKQTIGLTQINDNKNLAQAWAKLNGIDITNATWKDDKYITDSGETLVDVSNREQRMTKRAGIFNEVRQEYANQNFQEQGETETLDVLSTLDNAISQAREAGQKYGTDFSQGMLNALQSGEFNFNEIFDRLDPDEVTELTSKSDEEILQMMGMTEEQLAALGDMSAKEFADAFRKGFEGYEWDMNKALSAAMSARDENIDSLGLSKSKTEEYKEELQDYGAHIMRIAKDSEVFADSLDKDADSAVAVGLSIIQMNDGIDALADGFDDWANILKKSTKESEEYSDALNGIQDALSLVYGVEKDYISNDFVTKHLEEIKKVSEGSEEAIENLRKELTEDIIVNIAVYNDLDKSVQNDLLNMVHNLEAQIPDIKVGTEIDINDESYAGFLQTMQDIINTAGLTADQANALFSTMGFETNFATEEKPIEQTSPITVTETKVRDYTSGQTIGPDGQPRNWEYPVLETSTYQDGSTTHTGKMTVMAMTTGADGKTQVPKINSIVKKGTGAQNNYSSKNKGGGSPGSSKKSGGGSKKDPDKMDKVDDEPDRYHKVDTQLTKIGNQLDKIQSQEKKFTGAKLIQNLNQQLDKLDDRIDNLRKKQKIAYGEMNELQQKLGAQGVKFNDDGTIANYMEIYNSKLNYVNGLIDKYNSMSADEQEKYKETVEKAKEDYDKFKEQLDYYDELVSDTIPEISNDIQDSLDEEIELRIKKFDLEFDIQLNLKDANLEWNEFKKKILDGIKDDDIFGNARARAVDNMSVYLDENGNGFLSQATKRSQRVLEEIKKLDETGYSDVYGDDRQKALDALKASYQEINNALLEMDEIQKDVYQAWLDTMDDISDQMQEQVDMYEQIHDIVDHDMKVIELVYGESDYESLGKYYEQQHNNYLGLLDFQRQNVEFWENEMNSIQDKNSDAFKKARDNWMSAVKDLEGTVEDSIENAQAKMENAIDDTFQKFNDKITDGKGLDYVKQQWDLINDVEDDYLDKVNSAFGIRQLERKYLDAIDQTDNVSNQRKLNKLMEDELAKLREKDKLTEYDIERANKRYEIELKRLALEEAQQTKNTMRLRRDSQGNYRYEYVADEENIRKLQDELDVLENELYNFDKERWLEMQNQVVDAVQERQDAIKEILMDASLSEEERAERLAEINELYNQKIQDITDQTVTAQNNLYESGATELGKIWDEEGRDFNELNQEMQRQMVEEMLPQFEAGVNQMIDKFNGPGGFEEQTTESMEALSQKTQDYRQDLEDIETQAGYSFDAIEQGYDKVIPKAQELLENNDKLLENYGKQLKAIEELNKELDKHIKKYESIKQKAIEATQAAHDYWAEAQKQDAEDAANDPGQGGEPGKTDDEKQPTTTTDKGKGNDGGGKGGGNGIPEVGDVVTYTGGLYYYDSYGTAPAGSRGPGKKVTITSINSGAPYPIHVKSNDSAYGWLKKGQLQGYDTGGYTGDWAGDYGIPILAHKKELMLNKDDTANMLNIVSMVRDIVSMAGPRVGTLSANSNAVNSAAAALEQNVHIDANFPNVESAAEIEQALNNLVNLAAQRASRNTRG